MTHDFGNQTDLSLFLITRREFIEAGGATEMARIDREQVKPDWTKQGFSCDLWIDKPGQRWEDFTHPTDEVVLVLEGEMEFEIAGKVCHPEFGEELLIPA